MAKTLFERHKAYEEKTDYEILPKIPVIVKVNGKGFAKLTKNISKPFDHKLSTIFNQTMFSIVKQIEGVVFAYQYSDKIILTIRNDQTNDSEPWFGNKLQKINSVISSLVTHEFLFYRNEMDNPPELDGSTIFTVHTFPVPNFDEAVNYYIYRQYRCIQDAVNDTVYARLRTTYGASLQDVLEHKGTDERKELLKQEGIDFDKYPANFRFGSGCYLIPTIVKTDQGQFSRQKWICDLELPLFSNHRDFLRTIIKTGSDIIRPDRDFRR
jgi:tRNA(His) 5'-end guanylyltransferase